MSLGAGPGLALIAAVAWGAGDFSGGLATRRAAPFYVVSLAYALSLTGIISIALAIHAPLPGHRQASEALIAGLAGGLALTCFYKALSAGSMGAAASVSGVLTAAIPVAFAFTTQGLPHAIPLAGFLTAALAIWLIACTPGGAPQPGNLLLAVVSGCGFGIFLLFYNLASKDGVWWPLALCRAASLAVALGLSLVARLRSRPGDRPRWEGWGRVLPLAATAGFFDTGGNLFYGLSTRAGRLDIAAAISSLYPAATILLALWILRERATRVQAAGMALALASVALISS
jgi:drug/metabolite transporter (DMT)-like permease